MMSGHYPKQIREGVKNTKLAFDQETMWKEIEARIRKKKRRGILAVVPLLILTVMAFISWYSDITGSYYQDVIKHRESSGTRKDVKQFFVDVIQPTRATTAPFGQVDRHKKADPVNPVNQKVVAKMAAKVQENPKVPYLNIKEKIDSAADSMTDKTLYVEFLPACRPNNIVWSGKNDIVTGIKFPGKVAVSKKPLKGFLNLDAGLGFVTRQFSNKPSDDLYNEKLNRIKETESVLEQKMAGLTFTKPLTHTIYFSAGLVYRQITEKFQYTKTEKEEISHLDYFQSYRVKETRMTRYNANHFFDIHAEAAYALRLPKCNILPAIGLSYGFFSSYTGTLLSQNEDPLIVKKTEWLPDIWNLRISTQLQFQLYPDTYLTIVPLLSMGLNDFTRPKGDIYQRFHVYSMSVGLMKGMK